MATKLGAAYNVFDGEELLWRSIESIRPVVQFVVVVYQTTSNFGDAAASELMPTLQASLTFQHPNTYLSRSRRHSSSVASLTNLCFMRRKSLTSQLSANLFQMQLIHWSLVVHPMM
jgi:hypothetical protein